MLINELDAIKEKQAYNIFISIEFACKESRIATKRLLDDNNNIKMHYNQKYLNHYTIILNYYIYIYI